MATKLTRKDKFPTVPKTPRVKSLEMNTKLPQGRIAKRFAKNVTRRLDNC